MLTFSQASVQHQPLAQLSMVLHSHRVLRNDLSERFATCAFTLEYHQTPSDKLIRLEL